MGAPDRAREQPECRGFQLPREMPILFSRQPPSRRKHCGDHDLATISAAERLATHPAPKAVRWSIPRGRSFRIYRLAKKEKERGGSERAFEQTINWPTGQGAWIGD